MSQQPGETNIFKITDPDAYRCQIWHYEAKLSRLSIRVYRAQDRETPAFGLLFIDVAYWDGPMTWGGVDFRVASHDECIALMLETGLVGQAILQFPGAYASITEMARLFVVETKTRPIRLIASSGTQMTSV
jgi:hypothetical protein